MNEIILNASGPQQKQNTSRPAQRSKKLKKDDGRKAAPAKHIEPDIRNMAMMDRFSGLMDAIQPTGFPILGSTIAMNSGRYVVGVNGSILTYLHSFLETTKNC